MSTATEQEALEAICAHDLKLLETGELSDFSVICGGHTWKAHKAILCRNKYFEKLITSEFKESHENQIDIPNFEPFEVDLLLRYIYHPRVDAETACLQTPTQSFLETCVRLWHLGDYYKIETLAKSAGEQLRKRTERYIAEAGHAAGMLKGVPFAPEMECAIRVAWDPEKAPGPHRGLLLSLCHALAPFLSSCPGIITLFDEIPEFASEFSKSLLGCGAVYPERSPPRTSCRACGHSLRSLGDGVSDSRIIYQPKGTLAMLDGSGEGWYCSRECFHVMEPCNARHDHCEICRAWGMW